MAWEQKIQQEAELGAIQRCSTGLCAHFLHFSSTCSTSSSFANRKLLSNRKSISDIYQISQGHLLRTALVLLQLSLIFKGDFVILILCLINLLILINVFR